jgi:hypothetical protein
MANQVNHSNSAKNTSDANEEKMIAKEMSPFLIYAAIPVLIIVFLALKFGPTY